MALRQAWFFLTDTATGDGTDIFLIPSDCHCVWATFVSGGGGGSFQQVNSPNVGGVGGASSIPVVRYPLAVKPNGILVIAVGRGARGGSNISYGRLNANSSAPNLPRVLSEDDTNATTLDTTISGDILDPAFTQPIPLLSGGYAAAAIDHSRLSTVGLGTMTPAPPTKQLVFVADAANFGPNFPLNIVAAASIGESGAVYGTNTTAFGKPGLYTGNGSGVGAAGNYGPGVYGSYGSCSTGAFAYGDGGALGAGGVGGGNPFGTGGAGGTPYINGGQGGDGIGYGTGGGGGCWLAPGGNGANGFVLLEY